MRKILLSLLAPAALATAALDIATIVPASGADLDVHTRHHKRHVHARADDGYVCGARHFGRYRGYCTWTAERYDYYRSIPAFDGPAPYYGEGRYGYYAPPYDYQASYYEYVPHGYYRSYQPPLAYFDVLYDW